MSEQQRLSHDQRGNGQVHRVADVAICATDYEPLGWRDRRRSSDPFDSEPSKCSH
jgi:hypothetical protein